MGKSTGTEGKHLKLLEKGEGTDPLKMGQSQKYTDGPFCGPTFPGPAMCVHRCARGLGAGAWGLQNSPRIGTAIGCGETD